MADKKAEIAEVICRLVPAVERLSRFDDYDDVIPRARPPAAAAAIEAYEKYLGLRLPPYYRAFLELYDGYEALAFPGRDLLSIESVMPGGAHYDDIAEWKKLSTEVGAGVSSFVRYTIPMPTCALPMWTSRTCWSTSFSAIAFLV